MKKDITQILLAIDFATEKHKNQKRLGEEGLPYITHPANVATSLWANGVHDINIVVAAVLHDTLEDTDATSEEIKDKFGDKVLNLVLEVTDDKKLSRKEQKQNQINHAPHLSKGAKLIKLADKISNVGALIHSPPKWSKRKELNYLRQAKAVVDGLRGVNKKMEELFDDLTILAIQKIGER